MTETGPKKHRFKSVLEEQSPEHVKAIGLVSVEVTNLESSLGTLLAAIIDAPEQFGHIIYLTPKTSIARLEILENMIEYLLIKDSAGAKELDSIVKGAKAILGKRHRIIHGSWGITDGKVSVYSMPVQEGDKPEEFTVQQLERVVQDIRDLLETIATAIKALRIHHHEVRRKAGEKSVSGRAQKPSWRR